ncbi:IPT/TIG domain-containing protein [Plasmodiophora brassicae]
MVNNSQGTCLIPALPSGTTRITIAGAGLPVGSSAQQTALQTVDSSRLYSLSPSQAWQAAGGSASITVQGADFAPGAFCILQGVTPLSTLRLNSSALICTVPTTTPGRFALQVADPLYPAGSPSKLTFDVVPMPAAVPSSSTPLSTTYVTIVGTAFPQSSPVLCKFDDAPASPGFVLNATALVCQVPSASQAYGNATSVSLSIDNGATFRQLVAPWTTRTFPYATSDPVLAGVSPSWMIAGVPSKVVVYAAPLVSLSSHMTLSCLILPGTATPGTLLNGTAVDCGALVLFATSTVTIVIDNWYQLASTLAVSVYNQPVVSGVTPATLAWTGASASVTLTGANLLFPQCQCKFIAANLSTSWVTSPTSQTSRQVVCPVPGAIAPGASPVLVAVTDALQRFLSESPVALQVFAQQPTLASVSFVADAFSGGVTVTGANFLSSTDLRCVFTCAAPVPRRVPAPGTFLSATQVVCSVSSLAAIGCTSMTSLTVAVSNDLGVTSSAALPVPTAFSPTVASVSPSSGASAFDTVVTVVGSQLTSQSSCLFNGTLLVPLRSFVSAHEITCTLPAWQFPNQAQVSVAVINAVAPFASASVPFRLYLAPRLDAVSPAYATLSSLDTIALTVRGAGFTSPTSSYLTVNGVAVNATSIANSSFMTFALTPGVRGQTRLVPIQVSGVSLTFEAIPRVTIARIGSGTMLPTATLTLSTSPALGSQGTVTCAFTGPVTTSSSAATTVSSSAVSCALPDVYAGTVVNVTLLLDNAPYATNTLSLTLERLADAINVTSSWPALVTITGRGLAPPNVVQCRVRRGGSAPVNVSATVRSDATAQCAINGTALGWASGAVAVDVIVNGIRRNSTVVYAPALPPAVVSAYPLVGIPGTSTDIHLVFASAVADTSGAFCRFAVQTTAPVTFQSGTTASCPSPSSLPAGSAVQFQVILDSVATLDTNFTVYPMPTVSSVSPASPVPCDAYAFVSVSGSNLSPALPFTCLYTSSSSSSSASTSYSARVVSSSLLRCRLPSCNATTSITLAVACGAAQLFTAAIKQVATTVLYLSPATGPLGITQNVVLVGSGMVPGVQCEWDGAVITTPSPIFLNTTAVQCQAPPSLSPSSTVRLMNADGTLFNARTLVYRRTPVPALQRMVPSSGPVSGGTTLTLGGTNLTSASFCLFYATISSATPLATTPVAPVSSALATCPTPQSGLQVGVMFVALHSYGQALPFTVYAPTVVSAAASSAISPGTTDVVVQGANFMGTPSLSCLLNGVVVVPAVFNNASIVRCNVPEAVMTSANVTRVTLRVGNNGVDWSASYLVLSILATPPVVLSVWPVHVPAYIASGAAPIVITVTGAGFRSPTLCRFDRQTRTTVQASVVNSTTLTCQVTADGTTRVAVSTDNGLTFAESPVVLQRIAVPMVSVSPTAGALAGSDSIQVTGSGFVPGMQCRFAGTTVVPTTWLSSTSLTCWSPSAGSPSTVEVDLVVGGNVLGTAGAVFNYASLPTLSSVSPVSTWAGQTVTVTGTGFVDSPTLQCLFGGRVLARALFQSTTTVTCQAPMSEKVVGAVALQVGNDGVHWPTASLHVSVQPESIRGMTMSPVWAPSAGGTSVTITIAVLISRGDAVVACLFSADTYADTVPASNTTLSGSRFAILCVSPKMRTQARVTVQFVVRDVSGNQRVHPFEASFTYADLSVVSVTPNVATAQVTRTLTLRLANVPVVVPSPSRCFFDNGTVVTVPATSVASFAAQCQTPANLMPGLYRVGLQFPAGNIIPSQTVQLVLNPLPNVTNVHPLDGQTGGGETVYISGTGFAMSGEVQCRFTKGTSVVSAGARPLSPTQMACARPPLLPGTYRVSVSNDGVDFSTSQAFLYQVSLEATAVGVLAPAHGPVGGGTVVTLTGHNVTNSSSLRCRFHVDLQPDQLLPLTFVSTSVQTCTSPPTPFAAVATVDVVNVGVQSPYGSLTFTYDPVPIVTSASPVLFYAGTQGPALTIRGQNLLSPALQPNEVICRFNRTLGTTATVVRSNEIRCPSPASMAAGTYNLSISFNGQQYWPSGFTLAWRPQPAIVKLAPSLGPILGGTRVTVTVATPLFVADSVPVMCQFGSEPSSVGFVQNQTTVVCTSPSVASPGLVHVNVFYDVIGAGPNPPTVLFEYHAAVAAAQLFPSSSASSGGASAVFIKGPGVYNASLTRCIVVETQALLWTLVLSPNLILCHVPPGTTFPAPLQSSGIHIGLTHAPDLALPFTFTVPCPQGRMCVAGSEYPCPAGAKCTDHRTDGNFTACAPGTYQPEGGQSRCISCPAPFICPDYGTRTPVPCPPGFVCTVGSPADPAMLCPAGVVCAGNTLVPSLVQPAPTFALPSVAPRGTFYMYPFTGGDVASQIPSLCPNASYCVPGTAPGQQVPCELGANCGPGNFRPEGPGTPPGFYSPTPGTVLVPCPVGHYCPGLGNGVPIPCPRGSFAATTGNPVCVMCPAGSICPLSGMVQPLLCAPGLLCEGIGQQDEAQECPAGHFCQGGFATPCPPGTFCWEGVQTAQVAVWNFTFAQPCLAGTYCQEGSSDIYGSGFCQPGTYCPAGSTAPVAVVPGQYSMKVGNFRPLDCVPGTFSSTPNAAQCLSCPSGYKCPAFGMIRPVVCDRGYYRTQVDDVTCMPCPPGTWSDVLGLVDPSLCDPCPSGYVCGVTGMWQLSQATKCLEGYVCGQGTYPAIQFDALCPAGYACPAATTYSTMYEFLCPAGYICVEGTPYSLRDLYSCPKNRYCPLGTYRNKTGIDSNGRVVYEQLPLNSSIVRPGDLTTVWDKLWTVCATPTSPPGPAVTTEPCDFFTVRTPLPDGTVNVRYSQVCPLGTHSPVNSISIDNCTVIPNYGPATAFSPVDPSEVYDGIQLDIVGPVDYWVVNMEPLDTISINMNFSGIFTNLRYGVDWQVSIYEHEGATKRRRMPAGYGDPSLDKRSHLQLKILDTMPVHFTIRIEIINGRYLDAAMSFVNTTSLSRTWPNRAHFGTRDAFCMLLPITLGLELPLNLPRPDEDNFFIVDTTPPQYSLYYSSWNATPSVEVNPIVGDNFADVFVSLSHVQANNDDYFANPIMPYISQCRDFDSYAFFYQLFEHPNCTLETRPISAYQFGQSAVADRCDLVMDCIYEEPLSVSSTNPRWYQISHKEQPVFYITQTAVPYPTIAAGPQSLLGSLVPQLGNDYLVPVLASSLDPDSNTQKVPREVTFTVAYQQVDAYTKKIISAKLQFNSFDTNYSQSAYQFKVVMEPLQYTELVNNFAFGSDVYVILYLVIGTGLCAAGVVYWTIHKLTSRVKFKSRLLLSDFLRASEGPPLIALTLIAPPLLLAIVTLKFIFIDRNVFQGFSGTFTNFTPVDPLSPTGAQFESGRLTLALTALGMYLIGISSQMFIPRKVRRFRRFTADDHKQEQFEASVEEVHNAAEDESWAPRYWKRVHYISCCMLVSIVGVCMIEFSYSRFYFENTLAIIVVLKFMTPFINYGLRAMFKEALLVGPSQTMLGAIQFVMKMGAPDLTEFMIGFVTDVLLDTANVLYVVPLQVYLFEAVKKLLVRFRKAFNVHMKRRAVLAERERKRKLGLSVSDNLEEGLESGQEEEPEDDENDNDEVVEPLIDAYGDHVNTVIYLGLAPLTLTLLILFRTQTQIAITYSIKEDNLRYYLMFSAMIIPFVVVYNAFVVNILELFHGYRITAYLKYCQFAFQARDQRWCACETSMDMGIAEPLRSIHQMAFSSQYSLSVFVGACGMIMVAVGVEAEVRLNFNVFGDPVYPIVITIAFLIGIVIVKLCRFLADIVGLWRVRSRHSPRVKRDSKKMKITDWEEIEHMAAVAKMQLQAEMRRIETPRLLDSDFRDDFIKFNRVWLVLHLEEIVSPRNVRRDRSRALAQLGRVLLVGKTEKQQEVVVVSSDSSSGDEFEEALKAFKYAGINETGRKIGGGWLAIVRWRMRLRVHFRNIAEAWLDSHGCVCSHCGSRDTVQVESTPDMDHLVNRYHHMDEVTAPGSIDLSKWKNYLDSRAEFAAVCKRCIDEQEALRDALTRMSQPARTIAIMWLQTVRDILTKRKREADMKANATALSSDEDSADDYENVVKTAAKSITVSPISAQIYGLWLDMVRLMIIAKRREASGEWQQQAQSVVEASSSESDVEFAGLDAGDKNVVGPVSNITDQMIQYWLDGARLTIYQRQLDAIKATAGDAAAATSANDGGAQPSRAVAETNDGDGKTPEAESATLKGD